jgi:hypothetical protein
MASYQLNQGQGVSWLNLGQNRVDLPLGRSLGTGQGGYSGQTKAAFLLAQDRAVEKASQKARLVLSAIGAVEIPSGDQISTAKTVQSTNRYYWTGEAESRAAETTYLARVLNLAQARTIRSIELDRIGETDIGAGTYTLSLTEGDSEAVEFDFTVTYEEPFGDNNRLILNRLALAVEQHADNLSARVVEDARIDEAGYSTATVALEIRTRQTGAVEEYRLEDVSGNLAEGLELDGLQRSGADLTYLMGTTRSTPYETLTTNYRRGSEAETLTSLLEWSPARAEYQLNRTPTLDPGGRTDLAAGRYRFRIDQDGESRELTLNIDYHGFFPDDNESILTELGSALEQALSGIEARVLTGTALDSDGRPATGTTLYLAGLEGAEGQEFSLQDLDNDLIHRLGLDRVYHPLKVDDSASGGFSDNPADRFSLDATQLSTQVRQIFMDSPQKLTVSPAREVLIHQIRNVVTAHNSLVSTLSESRAFLGDSVRAGLAGDLLFSRGDLAELGLEVSSSGYVTMGREFAESLDRDLAGAREGLAGESGFLTLIRENLSTALAEGFDSFRTSRPGLIANDPPGSWSSGYDAYSSSVLGRIQVSGWGLGQNENQWLLSRLT